VGESTLSDLNIKQEISDKYSRSNQSLSWNVVALVDIVLTAGEMRMITV
jgi:hypothetical protein